MRFVGPFPLTFVVQTGGKGVLVRGEPPARNCGWGAGFPKFWGDYDEGKMEVAAMPKGCSRSEIHGDCVRNRILVVSSKLVCFSSRLLRPKKSSLSAASLLLAGLLFLLLGLSANNASAQAVYGSIAGTVIDSSGGGIAAAKITITDLNRNTVRTTETNGNGYYDQAHLIIGHYKVQVEAPGFKTAVTEVDVAVDTVSTFDVTLQPGDVKQTITVTDEVPLLKTERTDVSTTLSERQVDELPNFGRNF